MDYSEKQSKNRSLCLECGNVIRYGRTDKKYCCDECKTRHNNDLARAERVFRKKILKMIDRNYELLDRLVRKGEDSIDLAEFMAFGFVPGAVTSHRKSGKHDLYACYDIKYIMTPTRLYSIEKIRKL